MIQLGRQLVLSEHFKDWLIITEQNLLNYTE